MQSSLPPVSSAARAARKIPYWFTLINAGIDFRDRFTTVPTFSLQAEEALAVAMKETGVSEISTDISPLLEMHCRSLGPSHGLTPLARMARRKETINRVQRRLYLQDIEHRSPEIFQQPVTAPWFIVGLPRTGTTLLHRLLAQDPDHRAPLFWETELYYPLSFDPAQIQKRIRIARQNLRLVEWLDPDFKARHEIGAEMPEECLSLLCDGLVLGLRLDSSPEIRKWADRQDMLLSYRLHKQHLQVLQWKARSQKWILKSPVHLLYLPCLFEIYPDANIINTHRAPSEIIPSAASMLEALSRLKYQKLNRAEVGKQTVDELRLMLQKGISAREAQQAQPGSQNRFIDIQYTDLVRDPLGVVDQIYRVFGASLSDSVARRIKEYLAANRQHKFGKLHHTLEDFGLTDEDVSREFDFYTKRHLNGG